MVENEEKMNGTEDFPAKQKRGIMFWLIAAIALAASLALSISALIVAMANRQKTDGGRMDYETLFASVQPSVVEVYGAANNKRGSGVIYKIEEGQAYIFTNFHVVDATPTALVRFNEFGDKVESTLLGYDEYHDIAVLRVSAAEGAVAAKISGLPNTGMPVLAVGNSLGYGIAAFDGIVSKSNRIYTIGNKAVPVIAVTSPINAGMSGGGVFDSTGALVGIGTYQTTAVSDPSSGSGTRPVDGMSYAVPAEIAAKIARKIENNPSGGQIDRIDVRANPDIEDQVDFNGLYFRAKYTEKGLAVNVIAYAENDPPSSMQGGLPKVGDVVEKIGTLDITAQTGFVPLFSACLDYAHGGKGAPLTVVLRRGTETVTVTYYGLGRDDR
ncbi:MAG: serine protease [Clostridia bacterium]|nr:serine protease [Clostridia bacterium]